MDVRVYHTKGGVYKEALELSREEQVFWFNEFVNRMLNDNGFLRWVINHIDNLPEYKVYWNYYGSIHSKKHTFVGKPPKHL